MALPAALLLTCEAGTSIAIPRGVRGARRRSRATAPSGMAPFCISAPRHEPPRGYSARHDKEGVDGRATEGSAGHRGRSSPYWPQLSAGPPRRFPRRSRSPPRRRSPRRPRRRKRRRAPTLGACPSARASTGRRPTSSAASSRRRRTSSSSPTARSAWKLVDQAGALTAPHPHRRRLEQPPHRPHRVGQHDRRGSQGLVRVRRLRPPLRHPRGRPHDLRVLHRLHEPQRSLRHGAGDRLRGGLQRREAPGAPRQQPDRS